MCYNTRQTRKKAALQRWAQISSEIGELPEDMELIHYSANGWSHPIMWTITQESPNHLSPNMWGIMPSRENGVDFKEYFKNPRTFGGLNSKSEKLFNHFIYQHSWENQRCLIPVDGFFEPHNTRVKVKGKDFKVPFYFKRKDDDPMFLAGIYTNTADGRRTFSVLTKDATPMFEMIHNDKRRRPVIIDYDNKDEWLAPGLSEDEVQNLIDDDLWEGELEAYPVSKDLYSRTIDPNRPEIIDPVHYDEVSIDYPGRQKTNLFD